MSLIFEGREGIKLRTVNSEGSRLIKLRLIILKTFLGKRVRYLYDSFVKWNR